MIHTALNENTVGPKYKLLGAHFIAEVSNL